MRRIVFVSLTALVIAACSTEATSPADSTDQVTDFSIGAFGTALTSAGGYDADLYQLRLLHGLPDALKLTPEQETKIKALVDAFKLSTKADHDALETILHQAQDAKRAKKSDAEIKAILDQGIPARTRLAAAEAKLKTDIDNVLTAEQRAWLATHGPKKCKASTFPPLTDAQKAQMKAFEHAFETANRADLDAVKAGLHQLKEAITSGKPAADVQKILDAIKPALDRLEAARKTLRGQLEGVLTPEQKASGCFPLG